MQLVGDRFLVRDGCVIDLATGGRVQIIMSNVAASLDHRRWAERCGWLSALRHPAFATLIDYGIVGESRKFEAWSVDGEWRGGRAAGARARMSAACFLSANGRTSSTDMFVAVKDDRAVIVPSERDATHASAPEQDRAVAAVAHPADAPETASDDPSALGLLRPLDSRLHAFAEVFTQNGGGRLVAAAVCLSSDEDSRDVVRLLAREARVAGYVPIGARAIAGEVRRLASTRSCVFIVTDTPEAGWRRLLDAALSSAVSHMAIFVGHRAVRCVYSTGLRFWTEAELVAAVQPGIRLALQHRRVQAAARRASGSWSRFERLLFGNDEERRHAAAGAEWTRRARSAGSADGRPRESHSRAAEQAMGYTSDPVECGAVPVGVSRHVWPAPGEMTRLKHQLKLAGEAIARGRHALGERLLRQTAHALARRGAWTAAADAAVQLGRALLERGRIADVVDLVDVARPWAVNAEDVALLGSLAVLKAEALFEQGRLSDAESLFETSLCAALSAGDDVANAALAFARCLFWQGRYSEAWRRLALVEADVHGRPAYEIPWLVARSHVALGRDDVATSVAAAARARDIAAGLGDHSLVANAWLACALAQLASGDETQAEQSACAALAASRKAHSPLLSLRIRTLRAEIARRRHQRAPALLLLKRISAQPKLKLPATVSGPLALVRALLEAGHALAPAVERCVAASGLDAVRLFAPRKALAPGSTSLVADDFVELLRCCHAAQEDAAVLVAVCERVRERLTAIGAAFFGCDGAELVCLAGDGARIDGQAARRVHTANALVLPRHGGDRIEGGVPVRYAGQVIGVLAVRWTAAASWCDADVSLLTTTAAAAAAPALAGALARRAAARVPRAADVLGVSRAISDVRSALERAAGAPFPVLILGESGAGKELAARMLHKLGPRRDRPFCAINCAALPDDLLETELFGHARGAFTGAAVERRGVFEEAHSGTLFLDEVGELSPRAQAKLLRVIQEGEIRRVGENTSRRVDVRLVTATNRDLRHEVAADRFRLDLLYRLDVIRIALPSLRDRPEDIPVLIEHFWRDATERTGSRATLSASTVAALSRYRWPGNIRELQNVLASLAVRAAKRGVIGPSALPQHFVEAESETDFRLEVARQLFDRSFIRAALVRSGGQRSRAAHELGLSRQGLAKLMTKLGIDDDSTAAASVSAGASG